MAMLELWDPRPLESKVRNFSIVKDWQEKYNNRLVMLGDGVEEKFEDRVHENCLNAVDRNIVKNKVVNNAIPHSNT